MKNHSDEMIFHSQGLRRSAANLEDRIGEIANLKVHIRKTFKCEFHLASLCAKRFDMEVNMKKTLSLMLIVVTAVFMLTACSPKSKLVGTWTNDYQLDTIEFYENGEGMLKAWLAEYPITSWKVKKNVLTLTISNGYTDSTVSVEFKVDKDTLTIYGNGEEVEYVRVTE